MTGEQQVNERVSSDARTGGRRRGLRRQWLEAVAVMLTLVVSTGASAVLSSQFVIGKFTGTAAGLEEAGAYSARLTTVITAHENVAHALLANKAVDPIEVLAAQRAVDAEFAAGATLFDDVEMQRALDGVHDRWRAAFTEAGLWGPAILNFRFRGIDLPTHMVLSDGLDETAVALLAVEKHARADLRQGLAEARQSRQFAFGGVGAVVGLALLAMSYFARRMSLDVLRPIEALRSADTARVSASFSTQPGTRCPWRGRNGQFGSGRKILLGGRGAVEGDLGAVWVGGDDLPALRAALHRGVRDAERLEPTDPPVDGCPVCDQDGERVEAGRRGGHIGALAQGEGEGADRLVRDAAYGPVVVAELHREPQPEQPLVPVPTAPHVADRDLHVVQPEDRRRGGGHGATRRGGPRSSLPYFAASRASAGTSGAEGSGSVSESAGRPASATKPSNLAGEVICSSRQSLPPVTAKECEMERGSRTNEPSAAVQACSPQRTAS